MPRPFQKNLFLTETANIDSEYEESRITSPGDLPDVSDAIRGKCGNFWTTQKLSNKVVLFKDMSRFRMPIEMKFYEDAEHHPHELRSYSFHATESIKLTPSLAHYRTYNNTTPGAYEEELFINDALSDFNLPVGIGRLAALRLAQRNLTTQTFTDHTIKSQLPFAKEDIETGSMFSPPFVNLESKYNFYVEGYEESLSSIEEYKIPNMYSFIVASEGGIDDSSISAGGTLAPSSYSSFLSDPDGADTTALNSLKYFKPWAAAVLSSEYTSDEFKNVLFSSKSSSDIKKYNSKRRLFPMYSYIEYSSESGHNFGKAIKDSNLAFSFQKTIADSISGGSEGVYTQGLDLFKSVETLGKTQRYYRGRVAGMPRYGERQLSKVENSKYGLESLQIEIDEWFDRVVVPPPASIEDVDDATLEELRDARGALYDMDSGDFIVLDSDTASATGVERTNVLFQSIMSLALGAKLKELVKKKYRTFQQVMDGTPAYDETVLYKIEKSVGSRIIQSFYILNSTESDVDSFVDTQVKYNKEYTYKIFAYKLVIGTRYRYQYPRKDSSVGASSIKIDVIHEPSIRIIETEYFQKTSKIVDSPPMAPEVDFVPFKDEKNKVRLMLNGSPGQTSRKRTELEKELPEGINFYRTDDTISYFEVYRTTEEPKSYSDFSNKLVAEVYTDVSKETKLKASSVSYDDVISPNTKYYYVLRSVDIHGHKSYPSEVFKYEIVHDSGVTYPMLEVFHFDENKGIEYTTPAQKMINLIPSSRQMSISDSTIDSLSTTFLAAHVESVKLGDVEESLWGKKFRIRVTSKKTGRKIEIDVTFNHEHVKLRTSTSTAARSGHARSEFTDESSMTEKLGGGPLMPGDGDFDSIK